MKRMIKASTSQRNDELRQKWFVDMQDKYNKDGIGPKRLDDAMNIDWNDVTADDSEIVFVYDKEQFPDLSEIKSVRYFNNGEVKSAKELGYDGGYVVTYTDGSVQKLSWDTSKGDYEDVTDYI